jgi:hypothetical protein
MTTQPEIPCHPVQSHQVRRGAKVPQVVSLAAYEVYAKVFGPQPDLIEGHCRGGFGVNELIAFLYARSFPREEWEKRFEEALQGMEGL